ncbi:DUF6882 domain-containing protein [Streptomyces fagopyri]|uniref:DUF6882 domain-containing protein n=1 Tax=Streptomyces fagopyri TaxID=2662397 RepID=UPI00382180F7
MTSGGGGAHRTRRLPGGCHPRHRRRPRGPARSGPPWHPEPWLWAWANESILPGMSRDARTVRDWALAHGHPALAEPKAEAEAEADDHKAAALAALAVRITGATGFYRGPGNGASAIITFGPVTVTTRDGSTSTFRIDVGGQEPRRRQ